jgi:hypothetical protein
MYVQQAGGVPLDKHFLRIWTNRTTGSIVQVEARVEDEAKLSTLLGFLNSQFSPNVAPPIESLSSQEILTLVHSVINNSNDDHSIRGIKWTDKWVENLLVREVQVNGKYGFHTIQISIVDKKILGSTYIEFPQGGGEFSIPAKIYPIYEQTDKDAAILNGKLQARQFAYLKHLKYEIKKVGGDPYLPLRTQHFWGDQEDFINAETAAGKAQGLWSMADVKLAAKNLYNKLPDAKNSFKSGVILEGRYATVNLHPDILNAYKNLNFTPKASSEFKPNWITSLRAGEPADEMLPGGTLLGRPLKNYGDALSRVARRLQNHDPASYINDGFDELQVYYAINTLVEALHHMGFTDPELSTRRFNGFLYDPDISMKDNAFYTDDTINFTTYSPSALNFARDNSTIWHELGHGVMDRLMGDVITLADTGGLSEGMADFVAALIIQYTKHGKPFDGDHDFRIINHTGFLLTNEVHDDGEAYGGTMKDFLDAAISRDGQAGLVKVTDVVLEAMRLARNNPGLTAKDWFDHILFADELGHKPIRKPGELKALLLQSLSSRNFPTGSDAIAIYKLMNGADEVTSKTPGSRGNPISLELSQLETASFKLSVSLKNGDKYKFKYPVQVKVVLEGGPLEGAIHWQNEEQQPFIYQLNSESDVTAFDLTATGTCDRVNRADGSCVDYAYVQIWNNGETDKPVAKKRFYLRVKPKA